jgi:hypothetical protein
MIINVIFITIQVLYKFVDKITLHACVEYDALVFIQCLIIFCRCVFLPTFIITHNQELTLCGTRVTYISRLPAFAMLVLWTAES